MIRRSRLTIGLQLVLLLSACLVAMQVIILIVIALTPPPRPSIYRTSEIATALTGGALAVRDGRPLVLTVAPDLPRQLVDTPQRGSPPFDALVIGLGRAPQDIRILHERADRPGGIGRPHVSRHIILEHRRGPGGPPDYPGPPPELRRLVLGETPVFGDFIAALRRADGRWTIVRPAPEPFPSDWQRRTFLLLLAGFVLVALAGFWFARRITAPLKQFAEAAERLGRDPRAPPVTLDGPAEIAAAAEAFNNMQARLRRYIDDRTAMVGAISHDLRTPLARIRFKLESAPSDVKHSVLGDVAQMEQMLQGALAFIRDESTPRTRERLDLLSMLECVVDDAAMVGGDIELVESTPITVEGDPVALQRLFVNLADNAIKYGRLARIRVRRESDLAIVDITDAGPGLSADDLERVFQPFYRADASRNVDAGGMGLGLPIARSTARAHGGDVDLMSTAHGLIARVTLPAL